ncbi:MAG: MXAN_5187 C-terminal domain-containing protein [Vicinamibacterales bacterium]
MPELSDVQKDLQAIAAGLKQLEAEYNMFFAGRLPRPPWETRARVQALIKKWDRGYIQSAADRFQFETLQRRHQTFIDLWDRGLRAREEGRAGPFAQPPPPKAPPTPKEPPQKVVHVTSFHDPLREMDKLHSLYDSLMDARREAGEDVVPFHRFAALVKDQVGKIRETGTSEVAFRVAVVEGKVNLTVRGVTESDADE